VFDAGDVGRITTKDDDSNVGHERRFCRVLIIGPDTLESAE
jgi:hypothetical protein